MYVDAVTTAAVADELNRLVVGGRVQDVIEVDDRSIGLEIYAGGRHYLLMTVDPQAARVHLVPDRLRRGRQKPSPLGQLLDKYVDGARLQAVTQPPWERMLHLDFSGHAGETRLIAETMDRRSNLILTVEGDVLDSLKRIGPNQNRYRTILPGQPYVPPPPQKKIMPEAVTPSVMSSLLRRDPDCLAWRAIVGGVAGISPLFAREIVYFATGDAEVPCFDVSAGMMHAAFTQRIDEVTNGRWSPCVAPAPGGEGYIAFAAYPLTHLDDWRAVDSISEAMTLYFGAPVGMEAYTAAKGPVRAQIEEALDRLRGKLYSLEQQATDEKKIESLRKQGELLLAYGPTLSPGQRVLRAQYDPDGPVYEIDLDPDISPVANANSYFERYEKAKRAAEDVPKLRARTRLEIGYLRQLRTDLELAENWPEIDAVREALQEAGYWRGARQKGPGGGRPGIRRYTTPDGFVILAGRNAAQNHTLVTERASGDDLWLHARRLPGSHVIVKNDGRPIPDEVIQQAAMLAAYYSAGRADAAIDVDVTDRRYVRPIKGGKPGMVSYRNERTLHVTPRIPEAFQGG
jgi:predicted ribosome quality control (RQC) complex YloA/Tae2 family protein